METFMSQQLKALESSNWYQSITIIIVYNNVKRYINKLTILQNLRYMRKAQSNEGGIPMILIISQQPKALDS